MIAFLGLLLLNIALQPHAAHGPTRSTSLYVVGVFSTRKRLKLNLIVLF